MLMATAALKKPRSQPVYLSVMAGRASTSKTSVWMAPGAREIVDMTQQR